MPKRAGVTILLLLLGGGTAEAYRTHRPADPRTPTVEQAVAAVLEVFEAGSRDRMATLAAGEDPDPWDVAEALCFRGEHGAADAFARAAPRRAVEALPAYVTARRTAEPDTEAHLALEAQFVARRSRQWSRIPEIADALGDGAPTVTRLRIAGLRAAAFGRLRRRRESTEAYLSVAKSAARLGWLHGAADAYRDGGGAAYRASAWPVAKAAWIRALEAYRMLGDERGVARMLTRVGMIHECLAEFPDALRALERALEMHEAHGHHVGVAGTLQNIGVVHARMGDQRRALEVLSRALAAFAALGDRRGGMAALVGIGHAHGGLSEYARAQSAHEAALRLAEDMEDRAHVAASLINLASVLDRRGERDAALATFYRSVPLYEQVGNRYGLGQAFGTMAALHERRGEYRRALELLARALRLQHAIGDRGGVAATVVQIGGVHEKLADYSQALAHFGRALETFEKIGQRNEVASTLVRMGHVWRKRGEFPQALALYDRALAIHEALGDRGGVAQTLRSLGRTYARLGDDEKAMALYRRALAIYEAIGDREGVAVSLNSIGLLESREDHASALKSYERALALHRSMDNRGGVAVALGNIGGIYEALGDFPRALRGFTQAWKAFEALGRRDQIARSLGHIARLHSRRGDHARALEVYERALAIPVEEAGPWTRAYSLWGVAASHLGRGSFDEAIEAAHRAVDDISGLVARLGEQEGASARDLWTGPFEVGASAALRARRVEDLVSFLEGGRAGGLREALGARQALAEVLTPPGLRAAEVEARAREADAQAQLARARDRRDLRAVRAARRDLAAARDDLQEAVQRIQRDAKAGADVAYPQAAPLASIRAWLGADEALLLLGRTSREGVAVVVTPDLTEMRSLGPMAEIDALVERIDLTDPEEDPAALLDDLRERVVGKLEALRSATRVLVSPHGSLSYVPFQLLLPDAEVVCVPSGTTYGLLAEDRALRGEQVLALGDPDYDAPIEAPAGARVRGGRRLVALPGTREEVKAIADRVLLGREATEEGLARAVKERSRWRAVHLACHGLIDAERPLFSSLAFTPGSGSDGLLTCLEVFRARIPADLVVLSACETARGRIYRAEGIVGLTRAFMFAGAPRVICSLWKVDDKATRALMVKFYELWNPGEEGEGIGAAAALRAAQEYVRGHEQWKHPNYWAAWVLWGLP